MSLLVVRRPFLSSDPRSSCPCLTPPLSLERVETMIESMAGDQQRRALWELQENNVI